MSLEPVDPPLERLTAFCKALLISGSAPACLLLAASSSLSLSSSKKSRPSFVGEAAIFLPLVWPLVPLSLTRVSFSWRNSFSACCLACFFDCVLGGDCGLGGASAAKRGTTQGLPLHFSWQTFMSSLPPTVLAHR